MHIKQIKAMKYKKHTHPTVTKQQLEQKDKRVCAHALQQNQ